MSVPNPELLAILLASLAGSTHCLSMCGGLALSVTTRSPWSHIAYHGGRILSYAALGALAGGFGSVLLQKLPTTQMRWIALAFFAMAIILTAVRTWQGQMHAFLGMRVLGRIAARLFPSGARSTPLMAGLATALLPCGWLYGFVLLAAASGSPVRGALVLITFSLGTVPIFGLGSWGLRRVLQSRSVNLRKGIAVGLFVVGMFTLWNRASEPLPTASDSQSHSAHSCH